MLPTLFALLSVRSRTFLHVAVVAAATSAIATPIAAVSATCLAPLCKSYPANAGVIDVTKYGAVGDGVHDDTAAIKSAMLASDNNFGGAWWHNRIIYFPAGTYRVTDTLQKRTADGRYMSGMVLTGASPLLTRIVLADGAKGFNSAAVPKAVIFTSSMLLQSTATAGGKDYTNKGEGNDAYANYVEDMTIDVGKNNPGAVGIDYLANNSGAIRNVRLVASSGSGATGISMNRAWPGPALISGVDIEGFDVGISASSTEYGITFDKVALTNQRMVALHNSGNALSINDMLITGTMTGVVNEDPLGLITAVNLQFAGTASTTVAISNAGSMTLRKVQTARSAIFFGKSLAAGAAFEGVYLNNVRTQSATPTWALAAKTTPVIAPMDQPSAWANVQSYGAKADGVTDSASAIRQAVNSGASTVYFPYGDYVVNDYIEIPATVRHIIGMNSTLTVNRYNSAPFWLGTGILKVSGAHGSLLIEKLNFDLTNKGGKLAITYDGSGQLVIRDVVAAGLSLVNRAATGGELFIENYSGGAITVAGSSGVWIHQFDSEGNGAHIYNNGSPVWVSGIKTEGNATVVSATANSTTDVLGGLVYLVNPVTSPAPVFTVANSRVFGSYVEEALSAAATYKVYLQDVTPGQERSIAATSFPTRGFGRIVSKISTD